MPIAADSNIPTVAGYVQSVTFHLINRDGEKIDLEDVMYVVTNITELDALLSVKTRETKEPANPTKRLKLADAVVLLKHDLNPGKTAYTKWDEFQVLAKDNSQSHTSQPANSESWQSFAYNGQLNPLPSKPCHTGLGYERKTSFVDVVSEEGEFGLGDDIPGVKITLSGSQDTALLTTQNDLTIPGTITPVTKNSGGICTLGTPSTQDFSIKGWQFKTSNYPKESPGAPNPRVKLLWLSGYQES